MSNKSDNNSPPAVPSYGESRLAMGHTPETAAKEKAKFLGCAIASIAAVLIMIIALVWNSGQDSEPSRRPAVAAPRTVAQKLAIIDYKSNPGSEAEYDLLLGDLAVKCGEAKIDVSDTAVRGTQVMKEHRNVSITALEFLRAMDGAIPAHAENINCTEIAAALITLTGQ